MWREKDPTPNIYDEKAQMNNGMVISKVIFSQNLEMTIKACLEGVWGGESFELTA